MAGWASAAQKPQAKQASDQTHPTEPNRAAKPHLQHEALDDAVEDYAVVVTVARVRREVLDGAGALVGEEPQRHVPLGGPQHRAARQAARGRAGAVGGRELLRVWLLVEHVAAGLGGGVVRAVAVGCRRGVEVALPGVPAVRGGVG